MHFETRLAASSVVALAIGGGSWSAAAQPGGDVADCDEGVFSTGSAAYQHAWSESVVLRRMETACASSEHEVIYWQLRAGAENLIGNHRGALAAYDRLNYLRKPQRRSELPAGTGSLPALPYILEQAADHRGVLNPRTKYTNDRPAWMRMGGRRVAVSVETAACVEQACVVEAFDPHWAERAVPYDRVESSSATVEMYLPPGIRVELTGHRLDGSRVFRRSAMAPSPTANRTP